MFGGWGLDEISMEEKSNSFLPIDFGARTELGALNGGEALVMDSSMRADELIRRMEEAAAAEFEDVDYSCEGLLPCDEARVDQAYNTLFQS